ncbi:MAG: hypothetical protein KGS09_18580 [Nitrospirae bacterium]|nr:hypothetical protein [Nitrospirota bacterium]MDE3220895.1 hypothetical protein [Nitrospirota bacterium]
MPPACRPSASDHPRPSLSQAVEYLKKQKDLTVASALDELKALDRSLGVTTVYQQCFPRHYTRHLGQLKIAQPWNMGEKIFESFTELVSRKYFPVNNWDLEWVIESFPTIPIPLENFDVESEFEDVALPIQIAATMSGVYSYAPPWEAIQESLGPTITIPRCVLDREHQCTFEFDLFARLCQQHPLPVSTFPQVVQILAHNTGTAFLDFSYDYEMPDHGYTWTHGDILALQRQWRTARRLLRAMHRTVEQLKARPQAWSAIFACWDRICRLHRRTSS